MIDTKVAIVPAYEPGDEMVRVVEQLHAKGFQVVVVNDGSSKATRRTFDMVRDRATVLTHERNQGKGEAIKTGLRYVLDTFGVDCTIVTVDADGQHDVEDVAWVCEEAQKLPGSLVLGSRSFGGEVPLRSRLGNGVTRIVFRSASGISVRDTQTGLRAFSGTLAARMLDVKGSRYEYEMNVLMEFARAEVPLREVDIRTIYIDGNAASHFNPVKDSLLIYREILKFSASSFASFLIDYALFCLLLALTGVPAAANVGARVVSATANYTMNRTMVFGSSSPVAKSFAQYAALAAFVLTCNTVLLGALVWLGANPYVAKVAVELALFAFSYTIQRMFIFKKRKSGYVRKEKTNYETAYVGDRI